MMHDPLSLQGFLGRNGHALPSAVFDNCFARVNNDPEKVRGSLLV